jgi:PIN domain nuclease of toxin-antitoxin system
MRALLDTHAFLWYVLDDPQLGAKARSAISDGSNEILISPASYWELAIKVALGKYALALPYVEFWRTNIDVNHFSVLPVEVEHAAALVSMPPHHRDPFDRLLVAQALVEGIPLVSGDAALDAYAVTRIW